MFGRDSNLSLDNQKRILDDLTLKTFVFYVNFLILPNRYDPHFSLQSTYTYPTSCT